MVFQIKAFFLSFTSWSLNEQLLVLVISSLSALIIVLSRVYRNVCKKEQLIYSRANPKYLFLSGLIFIVGGKVIFWASRTQNTGFFAVIILSLTLLFAFFQYFTVGLGTILISWALWLSGMAVIIIYSQELFGVMSLTIDKIELTKASEYTSIQLMESVLSNFALIFTVCFLASIAFFGAEASVLWQRQDYTLRSKRLLTFAMALGLLVCIIMAAYWVLYPLVNMFKRLIALVI